jgi:HAE1 family hydrophobic/amphiphilic exporter-1
MTKLVSWFTEQSYRRAWIIILAVLFLIGYGSYSAATVKQELLPDLDFPLATLVVQSPGQQPEQIANNLIAPIESATSDLDGLRSTESTSVDGFGVILYNFEFGTSIEDIRRMLQDALDTTPAAANAQTSILTFDPSTQPVVTFDLRGDLGQAELQSIAEAQLIPQLSTLDGVASVEVVGGAIDEVRITLDRAQLLARGITYDQVAQALTTNNVVLPSGQLPSEGSTIPLQTVSILTSVDAIRALPLTAADGSTITLGDIATVEQAEGTSVGYSRTDGQPSVSIRVTKEKEANTVDVAHRVTDKLDELAPSLPSGASVSIFEDLSEFITDSVNAVIQEGIIGGVLAVVIVFLFLRNWRTTLITAVSIPLSLLTAIIVLDRMGYSLNIMTLAGLTIAIGRVIDDTIVVLENVYRHMANGERPFDAVMKGAREVTIAIVGATAVTCAVFLPLGLTGGLIGALFLPFAVAVVAALIASLLVAVTVVPVLSRLLLVGKVKPEPEKHPGDSWAGRVYTRLLRWALGNRWKTLIGAFVLLIASFALVPTLPVAFLPDSGENIITVNVDARPGQTADSVLDQAIAVEGLLGELDPETYQTIITGASSDIGSIGNIISGNSPNSATITVELHSDVDRQDAADELRQSIAANLPGSDNISVSSAGDSFSSGVVITLSAETAEGLAALPDFASQVAQTVGTVDDVVNVSSNLSAVQNTIQVTVDPAKAAQAGLTPAQISAQLANLSTNATITTATIDGQAYPIRLQVSGGEANTIDALGALEIAKGVPLNSVATLTEVPTQVTITRVDGEPAASITADITSNDTGGVAADVQSAVDKLPVPAGIDVKHGGVAGDIGEGFTNLLIAILIAIVLVYAIMGLLFRSWLDPLVILFSLPLAAIGAIVALAVTGSPLSLSAMIGMLMLVGIVVTNAIVLLEFVIMLRKERGYSLHDALIEGGQTRLRPILMTAFAAMLALIPLSLGLTEGLLIASDLGRVVIGGLFTSTLLTLLVVPVVYSFADGVKRRVHRRRKHDEVESQELAAV